MLEKYKVELIGAKLPAIKKAEDRELFKKAMEHIGLEVPKSGFATSMEQAYEILEMVGFPAILRPAFTLGGTGGGIAYNREEFTDLITRGLDASPVHQVLIEESVVGWKEYELEVMRDTKDNVVIVCSIENLDPMGIHTGDSITVAPAQTLTDKEYQLMRDASLKIIREIGVDTGGSNIQFAVNPDDGRMIVIEMNPRVSRSSALASKATGFAIAKIAAKLAVGYTLDEITNDITKATPASFEPTIDYVVVKFPRFAFEKFPQADATLTTQMKSVGEAMSIGRTFKESLQKALRSLEIDRYGFESRRDRDGDAEHGIADIRQKISVPNWERIWYIADGFRLGMTVEEIFTLSKIDPWFLHQIKQIVDMEKDPGEGGARPERRDLPRSIIRSGSPRSTVFRTAGSPGCSPPRKTRSERPVWSSASLRCSRRWTPAPPSSRRIRRICIRRMRNRSIKSQAQGAGAGGSGVRGESDGPQEDRDPRRRAEPDRPGHRVRLLLRARGVRAQGRRLRDDHGELQPRDREHGLRHVGPAVF